MATYYSTLPGKSHGGRSLVGCSSCGRKGSDTTEQLHFHFSLSCTGEGNGNLLQYTCLENPRDGEAWWAAVYGVSQSQTQLTWLSTSSIWSSWMQKWSHQFLLLLIFSMGGFFHKVSSKIPESDYVFKRSPSWRGGDIPPFPWTESQIATLYR